MKNTIQVFSLFLLGLLFVSRSVSVWSQQNPETYEPVFTCDEMVHDFGKVREKDSYAVHEFVVKNSGTAPLVITRVLTTCGCAQPEWSTQPIEPGQEGFVVVSYDMVNRPGPFSKNITVFTNERTLRHVLTIKGDVIPKPEILNVLFHDTIGTVQMEKTDFSFDAVRPHEIKSSEMWIQNFGEEDLNLVIEDVPEYIIITVPSRLESNFPERMIVEVNASKVEENRRGRQLDQFTWKTENASGETITKTIPVSVNFIDDFRSMTSAERAEASSLQISTSFLNYGKLKNKRVYKELTITNQGKSPLHIHSLTVDDSKTTQISGFSKRILLPNETLKLKIYVNPKEVNGNYFTNLFVVSNDVRRPVQEVKIAFEK